MTDLTTGPDLARLALGGNPVHVIPPHHALPCLWVWVRSLPVASWPVVVVRKDDKTLVMIQEGVSRSYAALRCHDLLNEDELNYIRAAYGQPPVGQHAAEYIFAGVVSASTLPDILNAERQQRRNDATALGA